METSLTWQKPAACNNDSNCPNWAWASDGSLMLRDSNNPDLVLRLEAADALAFLQAAVNGEVAPQA